MGGELSLRWLFFGGVRCWRFGRRVKLLCGLGGGVVLGVSPHSANGGGSLVGAWNLYGQNMIICITGENIVLDNALDIV